MLLLHALGAFIVHARVIIMSSKYLTVSGKQLSSALFGNNRSHLYGICD